MRQLAIAMFLVVLFQMNSPYSLSPAIESSFERLASLIEARVAQDNVATQIKMRTIGDVRKEVGTEQSPLEIVSYRVGAATIKPNVSFVASEDWISELEMVVKNQSQSTIVNLAITFEMPSDRRFPKIPVAWLGEGQCNYAATASGTSIKPGESITIRFNRSEQIETGYKKWRKTMAENGLLVIDKVQPVIEGVLLEDGRRWSRGYYLKKNPDDPNRWDVIR